MLTIPDGCLGSSGAWLPFIITNLDQTRPISLRVIKTLEDFILSKLVAVFLFVLFCGTNGGQLRPLLALGLRGGRARVQAGFWQPSFEAVL